MKLVYCLHDVYYNRIVYEFMKLAYCLHYVYYNMSVSLCEQGATVAKSASANEVHNRQGLW